MNVFQRREKTEMNNVALENTARESTELSQISKNMFLFGISLQYALEDRREERP